jgi:hypothetical protein
MSKNFGIGSEEGRCDMIFWNEKPHEFEENSEHKEEKSYDEQEEELDEQLKTIPKEWWTEEVERIPDTELKKKEIDNAKKIAEKEKRLNDKLKSSEISKDRYDFEKLRVLNRKKAKFATRCALESVDLSWDDFGDILEDYDIAVSGNLKTAEMKQGVQKLIQNRGPEYAKEVADRMLEKNALSNPTYETIMRQIRRHGKKA